MNGNTVTELEKTLLSRKADINPRPKRRAVAEPRMMILPRKTI